ncbi:membrane bound O-acyl transferase family-domain-containing protein [Bisporella sp. PMI_857]|nr:membrane bound O-acyl transferase family-domain-containing protein [Bisporella sp. PMI_857]
MIKSVFNSEDLPPPPPWIQAVLSILCIVTILLPAGPIRLSSGGLILGSVLYLVFCTRQQTSDAYIMANSCVSMLYRWLDLVAIHNPEKDLWRVSSKATPEDKVKGSAPKGIMKSRWFSALSFSPRAVGWNIQVRSPPGPSDDYPRTKFLREHLRRVVVAYLGLDITTYISAQLWPSSSFFDLPMYAQVFHAWVQVFKAYHGIEFAYSVGAVLTVTLGICKPKDWPPISGSFRRDGWSVRRMWGECWHQMVRRPCSEAGRLTVKLFGFRKGSFMSRYSQVWVAFLASAVMHHSGAMVAAYEDGGFWQAAYFMVQPVAYMMEDFVMFLGRRAGIEASGWTRAIGRLWVFLWFSVTMRFMVANQPLSFVQTASIPSLTEYVANIAHF